MKARTPAARPSFDGTAALKAALRSAHAARSKKPKKGTGHAGESAAESESASGAPVRFATAFAASFGDSIARNLSHTFKGTVSGEITSAAAKGLKRLDLKFSTLEAGLEFGISFKSVHFGEKDGGTAKFVHNRKRNDEELRVEATGHHLRQPYSVLAAVLFLPFEACSDQGKDGTSSFAKWVEYLWPLRGRTEPEDPPDMFELVFIALYARDGSEIEFYEVGGAAPCPRTGRPKCLTPENFLQRLERVYRVRNKQDFYFEGEGPD